MSSEEEYRGSAVLVSDDDEMTVDVHLTARFEPVEGRFRWAGRAARNEDLTARMRSGARSVTIRIGTGPPVDARLGEPDPWGRIRLTGVGRPPW